MAWDLHPQLPSRYAAVYAFFLEGFNCGAITEAEALTTGLTVDELRSRSFAQIVRARRAAQPSSGPP